MTISPAPLHRLVGRMRFSLQNLRIAIVFTLYLLLCILMNIILAISEIFVVSFNIIIIGTMNDAKFWRKFNPPNVKDQPAGASAPSQAQTNPDARSAASPCWAAQMQPDTTNPRNTP